MEYILAIDDTDNLDSPGTGEHLENITALLEDRHDCVCSRVTRHQLFFSPLVKYTSHNSAMSAIISTDRTPDEVFGAACAYLEKNAAEGSDPGACLLIKDAVSEIAAETLAAYGQRAKSEYIEKSEAYALAAKHDILLKELGGEGIGVIGALAGAALRLGGNDGRYKGNFEVGVNFDNMLCADILSHPYIDHIMLEDGTAVPKDEEVYITEQIKTVHLAGQSVLLVKRQQTVDGEALVNLAKSELKKY